MQAAAKGRAKEPATAAAVGQTSNEQGQWCIFLILHFAGNLSDEYCLQPHVLFTGYVTPLINTFNCKLTSHRTSVVDRLTSSYKSHPVQTLRGRVSLL